MQSCRFAFAIHILAVMALKRERFYTSAQLAATVNTNPVGIRRLLLELQGAGLIRTQRGPQGGAILAQKPVKISLLAIHEAVDRSQLFGLHRNQPSEACIVGKRIGTVLEGIQSRAQRSFARELGKMNLEEVVRQLSASGKAETAGANLTGAKQR